MVRARWDRRAAAETGRLALQGREYLGGDQLQVLDVVEVKYLQVGPASADLLVLLELGDDLFRRAAERVFAQLV